MTKYGRLTGKANLEAAGNHGIDAMWHNVLFIYLFIPAFAKHHKEIKIRYMSPATRHLKEGELRAKGEKQNCLDGARFIFFLRD